MLLHCWIDIILIRVNVNIYLKKNSFLFLCISMHILYYSFVLWRTIIRFVQHEMFIRSCLSIIINLSNIFHVLQWIGCDSSGSNGFSGHREMRNWEERCYLGLWAQVHVRGSGSEKQTLKSIWAGSSNNRAALVFLFCPLQPRQSH